MHLAIRRLTRPVRPPAAGVPTSPMPLLRGWPRWCPAAGKPRSIAGASSGEPPAPPSRFGTAGPSRWLIAIAGRPPIMIGPRRPHDDLHGIALRSEGHHRALPSRVRRVRESVLEPTSRLTYSGPPITLLPSALCRPFAARASIGRPARSAVPAFVKPIASRVLSAPVLQFDPAFAIARI